MLWLAWSQSIMHGNSSASDTADAGAPLDPMAQGSSSRPKFSGSGPAGDPCDDAPDIEVTWQQATLSNFELLLMDAS